MTVLELAALDGGTVALPAEQTDGLAARLQGTVLHPGDDGWDDAVLIWNAMVARQPGLVVQPVSAADVVTCVRFVTDHGLLLGVKGGGHNIAGTGVADGALVLDLSRMCSVTVDPQARWADVGPGCRLADVDRATQAHGLATVLGFVSQVGVAGLTLGGGLGYLTRRFGWTVDNLEEVDVVCADGVLRTASRDRHSDLFWAVRGAGANLGVVTRFRFRLHPVGPTVVGGLLAWPFERADEVLATYRSLTATAPRELAVWLILLTAPPEPFVPDEWHGRRLCAMSVCFTGPVEDAEAALAPLRALGEPVVDLVGPLPYTEVQSYLDDGEPKGQHYYWKTGYVSSLTPALLRTATELFAECPVPGAEIGLLHLEGALGERPADDGAVGNRDARFVLGVNGMWEPDDPQATSHTQWVRAAWERVRPFTTGASYINFQTADEEEDRVRATYGAGYERVAQVKARYDPGNLFRLNRNVLPLHPAGRPS